MYAQVSILVGYPNVEGASVGNGKEDGTDEALGGLQD